MVDERRYGGDLHNNSRGPSGSTSTERWKDDLLSFTIVTTGACDGTKDLHGRMPLVLDQEGFEPWLAGETPTLSSNVDEDLHFFSVTPQMNKPAYNEPDCIAPLVA